VRLRGARGAGRGLAAARRTTGHGWEPARSPAGSAAGPRAGARPCGASSPSTLGSSGAEVPDFPGLAGALPGHRAAPLLAGLPRTWRRGWRCALTAAGGARLPTPGRSASCRTPGAPASPGVHLLPAPNSAPGARTRTGQPRIHGAGGKLVSGLRKPLPGTRTHAPGPLAPPGPRSSGVLEDPTQPPTYFRGPSRARPAGRAVVSSGARAAPDRPARSGSCEPPKAARRAAGTASE
jgi:hypothetical protein